MQNVSANQFIVDFVCNETEGLSGTTLVEDDDLDLPVIGTIDDTKGDGRYPALVGFAIVI